MSTGIVCEFNPFHNGHKYLIDCAREKTGESIVCAMSGNFVQRGEWAFADKFLRAKWAVDSGADLVFENPFPFSCATAEVFAKSAVSILAKSGCDSIAFGIEDKEITPADLVEAAKILLDEKVCKEIIGIQKENKNIGYAVARSLCVSEKYGEKYTKLLAAPNSLLAVEYAKAIVFFGYDMQMITIGRKGAEHDGAPCGKFASGSFLRENFSKENIKNYCTETVAESLNFARRVDEKGFYSALCARIFSMNEDELSDIAELPGEYAQKLVRKACEYENYGEFFGSLRAKHMTDAKIRRMLIYLLADVKKQDLLHFPDAANLLSFSDDGAKLLRKIKKENIDFTVLSKVSDMKKLCEKDRAVFEKQLLVEKLFERVSV
ncbi:MAG: nucleotidyltransferase family protein [Ruminococcaceae bacterium]|nr:nucleotidyltransferase family protein [Oscillospiraceae bacterium]